MRLTHSFYDERHYRRKRNETLAVGRLHVEARAVVLQIKADGVNQVVRTVTAKGALKAQLIGQPLSSI